ncbi:EscE/YscE/SsaE family type III secretion system needle protein co-chaperone [Imhoffiella purpurea]|uniref:Uncharacterized protein n=1 Tax=Imhoffiella purpurea TaxID=1249627 RepID=W9V7V3_9GAMM|nr:EscE/YscE/SsaE family type III secretion system needle protein co-chaperone [Imhoffiella purpurea]EXJ15663.1 hypothetical protein D779_1170 [Imhoffiella purpurea]
MTDEANEPWFEIERRLMDDQDGRERDGIQSRLEEAARPLKRQLDAGVTPAEFARLNAVLEGLEAGRDLVMQVWRAHHPSV